MKTTYGSPQEFSSADFQFRYLQEADYHRGMFEVLNQLSSAKKPSFQDFKNFWVSQSQMSAKHINIVGLDRKTDKIIAFGTILIVNEVLNGKVGKIENIVTCKSVRGKGLGKTVIDVLKMEGWRQGCDVIGLFCAQHNVKFYEKLGFKTEGRVFDYRQSS